MKSVAYYGNLMMKMINIKKGKDLNLCGVAQRDVEVCTLPHTVAVKPLDFYGFKARVLVKEGDVVKIGTPLLENKQDERIKIPSSVSGCLIEIRRGEKRKLLELVIQPDERQEALLFAKFDPIQISDLSREQIVKHLLDTGSWAFLRQRPFDFIADPDERPKSIFIKAIDTNPLAANYDIVLAGQDEEFQFGLEVMRKLTKGPVYLCAQKKADCLALLRARKVNLVKFDGPHPAGNVGTHIHELDPIDKNEIVWYLDAQDVVAIAKSFLTGCFSPERVIVVAGERAEKPMYKKTIRGVNIKTLTGQHSFDDTRVISGSVLTGNDVGANGFVGFYDTQVSLIPKGGRRKLLGWTMPGLNKFSFSRTFLSTLRGGKAAKIDTDIHGSERAIVFNNIYDQYVALDVLTFFLIRAILAGEIEEMERLGILECSPEDFALAAFACPSKTDICGIIQQGLDLIEKEG